MVQAPDIGVFVSVYPCADDCNVLDKLDHLRCAEGEGGTDQAHSQQVCQAVTRLRHHKDVLVPQLVNFQHIDGLEFTIDADGMCMV